MLARVNSPFVTNLKYAFSTKDDLYLAIDLMTGGDLSFQLSKSQYFNEETARFIAAQVLLGLEHLHSKGIIYRYVLFNWTLSARDITSVAHTLCVEQWGVNRIN